MKNAIRQKKSYQVTFNQPKYNAVYTFERGKSSAFALSNRIIVIIRKNGKLMNVCYPQNEWAVMQDFGKWCESLLTQMFDPDFEPAFKEVEYPRQYI